MNNVKRYFKDYPASNVVFETNDGLLFHQDGDAALHAKDLKIKTVTTHLRENAAIDPREVSTIPVIDKVVTHNVPSTEGGTGAEVVTVQSLQIPVTPEVKEQFDTAEKASGAIVTDTSTQLPERAEQQNGNDKPAETATGEVAANSQVKAENRTKPAK